MALMTREEEERRVRVPAARVHLEGILTVPEDARGVVLFAHGSGSSRRSPRNGYVAAYLRKGGLATLLIDLLTPEEEEADLETKQLRFDIRLLSARVVGAIDWLSAHESTRSLAIGCFGASTGAAAALVAAAERPESVDAVVSRGGRPDLAGDALERVEPPTLLIVGGWDREVLQLNRQAMRRMPARCSLEIVPQATHLFEEPGALEQVARLAREWFQQYLNPK